MGFKEKLRGLCPGEAPGTGSVEIMKELQENQEGRKPYRRELFQGDVNSFCKGPEWDREEACGLKWL